MVFSDSIPRMADRRERGLSISEEIATSLSREFHTGSGLGGSRETEARDRLKRHLGTDSTESSAPELAVIGELLISYVTVSTRLIAKLDGQTDYDIREEILDYLRIRGTPQETFRKLLDVVARNSARINLG